MLARLLLILVFILGPAFIWTQPALAQSGPIEVQTLAVDYTAFPNICLRAAPIAADGTLLGDLPSEALQVYENGEPRPVTSTNKEYVGSAVAIVFDASGSFDRPGSQPNTRRFDDAIAALDELVLSKGKWLQQDPKVDQLMLIAPTGPDAYKIASTWTNEPVKIHNDAYPLERIKTDTPLYKMLIEAMVRMKDLTDWERRAKFLLVFSDGVDRTSANDVTDVINRANNLGVKVLSVKIGPDGTSKTLERMARETPRGDSVADWSYVNYNGIQSLAPLYGAIRSRGEQLKLCYRSKINAAGPTSVELAVKQGDREYRSPTRTISVPVKPPSVRITDPTDGVVYERIANSWDQDVKTIEPFEQAVTVEVAWPDGYPRGIEQVIYEVDGRNVAGLSTDETFIWNFADLGAGIHSLQVKVRDELGMEGASEPARAEIILKIPPAPTATPIVLPSPTPPPAITGNDTVDNVIRPLINQPVMLAVLVIAIIAAVLALIALIKLLRSPQRLEQMTQTVTGVVRDVTEVFRPKRGPAASARAELIPIIDDAGTRGPAIPIRWQSTTIGRDPERAQITFAEKSVSRLHARIVEDADHVFVLHDEGSASGTFANEEQVDVARPRTLKSGDLLEFGRVKVIFQLGSSAGGKDAAVGSDVTEPLAINRKR